MAGTDKFILEYQLMFDERGIDCQNAKLPKKSMMRLIRLTERIEDPRKEKMTEYPLSEIIIITFLAIIAGANKWEDMEIFGKSYGRWLGKFLELKNGIASHDTFRRVFGLVKSKELEEVTVIFMAEIIVKLKKSLKIKTDGKRHISVDGKEAKSTGRKIDTKEEIRNLQTLHVYENTHGICLYSSVIDSKTNEIPVAQTILGCMDLKDSIVTFDTMNTQKDTIDIIIEQKGDYVGALKGNQNLFERDVKEYFTPEMLLQIKENNKGYFISIQKAHNQIETREYFLTDDVKWFEELKKWKNCKSFICYKKKIVNLVSGKESLESRYYISSETDIEICAQAIRGHWGIENSLHWHLDTEFGEDFNTTADRTAFNNLSIINKMALSVLKLAKPVFKHNSIRQMRMQFGWFMEDNLSKVFNFLSDEEFLEGMKLESSKQM